MVGAVNAKEALRSPESDEHPLAGLVTPEDLERIQEDEARGYRAAFEGVPMPRGYHERREAIQNQGLEAIHCPVCSWPGIAVLQDSRGILINHHGRAFACRVRVTS